MKKVILTFAALIVSCLAYSNTTIFVAATEERNVGEFESIHISGWYDVTLTEGKEGKITLEGKPSILENITTEVVNGKLKIKWDKYVKLSPFQGMSKVLITIPVEEIDAVVLSGSGSVVSNKTLRSDTFDTTLSGSGSIELNIETSSLSSTISGSGNTVLSGKTGTFKVQISGSGDIKAYELKADDVTASISGSAKIKVYANTSVTASISGSGDVKYMGPAKKINSKVSGSGSVSKV